MKIKLKEAITVLKITLGVTLVLALVLVIVFYDELRCFGYWCY